ncbi:unnamed protein product [Auanema sp. JU1783]|nr:unnamed protein product [Auanema sp. JU1783]
MSHNFYCEQLDLVVKSKVTIALFVIKMIICFVGLIAMILNVKYLGTRWVVHPNARVLYIAVLIFSFLICFQYSIMYSVDSYRFLTSTKYCDALISTRLSFITLVFGICFEVSLVNIFLAMSTERLIASLFPAYYEKIQTNTLGLSLIAIALILEIPIIYGIVKYPIDWDEPSIAFSIITEDNQLEYKVLIIVMLSYEVISIVIFHFVLIRNRQHALERYHNDLAVNYQKSENMKMGLFFLPVYYCHFIITIVYMGSFSVYSMVTPPEELATFAIFAEYVAWTPLYASAMSLILYLTKRYYVRNQKKVNQKHSGSVFIPLDKLFQFQKAHKLSTVQLVMKRIFPCN